ncbi:rhodanese-like domain-containing protein [Geobacter sulfurreducens]|uniref:rhodanese-like domain-containing protein n=1 Tax=Geobacter sulfurreducens TaxID=35554 RepID=UPI0005DA430D|nr:rhodanese-like domain-containing protein [Geobacter sulfurreducens]AJY68748.1 sulfurtransferase [Geobacter sulfurreducens]QVW34342.1 rhodanese-like domain-containing protein [Geobacter sulfurreducens]UTG91867.1 rhodanese-like domain-containing protein [Geobacter sulfurreducens]
MKRIVQRALACAVLALGILAGGAGWAAGDYPVVTTDHLKAMIDEKQDFLLIDARTPEEYAEAHIVGAVNVPEKTFDSASAQLPADKAKLIVFYCNGIKCGKSKRVAKKVEPLGYTTIAVYNEGMPVWEERGLPIVKGASYGKKIETTKVPAAELDRMIRSGSQDYILIDVRDEMEFEEGHIPTAINIPAEQLAARSDQLPKEKKIIVYCNTGSRSYMAYKKLIGLAYPSIFQSLFVEWKEAGLPVAR